MACFLVPAAQAVATTIAQKAMGKEMAEKMKIKWLNGMLWGGVVVLAVEHVWHGEIVPWPPFLTAMENPAEIGPMLNEMAVIGGTMTLTITFVWMVMVIISHVLARKAGSKMPVGV